MLQFDIITLFPSAFSYFEESIIKRAKEKKLIEIKFYNLRDFTKDKHKKVDDRPYGGGAGMVLKIEPIIAAVGSILKSKVKSPRSRTSSLRGRQKSKARTKVILLSAKGKQFNQDMAHRFARYDRLIFICGRYEGIDERAKQILKAEEVSIGPYILTDGDIASMVVVSAVSRLLPGVLGKEKSLAEESFSCVARSKNSKFEIRNSKFITEYPHYTRPEIFEYKGKKYRVPSVLLSGDHKKIKEWRRKHGMCISSDTFVSP